MKTLKYSVAIVILGASLNAFAKKAPPVDYSTYIPVLRENTNTSGDDRGDEVMSCIDNMNNLLGSIESKIGLSPIVHSYKGQPTKTEMEAQYECSEVVFTATHSQGSYGSGLWSGFERTHYGKLQVAVYCKSRSLGEKQAFAQARRCETQPGPECYSKEYLDYVNSVQATKVIRTFDVKQLCGGSNAMR